MLGKNIIERQMEKHRGFFFLIFSFWGEYNYTKHRDKNKHRGRQTNTGNFFSFSFLENIHKTLNTDGRKQAWGEHQRQTEQKQRNKKQAKGRFEEGESMLKIKK